MKVIKLAAVALALIPVQLSAEPADREIFGSSAPRFESDPAGEMEKNINEGMEIAERLERERVAEELRDKSHDNRIPVGEDTSIGVSGDGVNIRHTY